MSNFVNVAEAKRRLDVTDRTVRNWCRAGNLDCEHVGGQWLIAAECLPAADAPPDQLPVKRPAKPVPAPTAAPAIDLGPLAELLDRAMSQNASLAAEVAVLRDRLSRAEAALSAIGPGDATEEAESASPPASVPSVIASLLARLRRS